MKTCTFKKALSLLLAVMMVISCVTVLSVGAAAATWPGFMSAQDAYDRYAANTEWIPVGKDTGNGTGDINDTSFIYGFYQDSFTIYAFIEYGADAKDITVRLDSNRDTLTARSHELVFSGLKQQNCEYGLDEDVTGINPQGVTGKPGVTSGKFTDGTKADFAGTSYTQGVSYEYGFINVTKNYTGADNTARTAGVLVLQFRKDRLQGNAGNGVWDYVSKLGFDIELVNDAGKTVHSSNAGAAAANNATNFNIYDTTVSKEGKVDRFDCDGQITGNEFWKADQWQLVTGLNGQVIGNVDQTDIAYEFQVIGDNKNVYIAAKLYGESYKDENGASKFVVYLNADEDAAKAAGNEPTAILEFVYDGNKYVFQGTNSRFIHLRVASWTKDETLTTVEIEIPYRDILLSSPDFKYGDPYNYLGFNFEFSSSATYSNEQTLVSLVARTFGKDADHPAYNCEASNYFTFKSNSDMYNKANYAVGVYNAADYNNDLAVECGKITSRNEIDALVNELADNLAANQQVITYRVSAAMYTGKWTNGYPGENDNRPASFANTYFDYIMFSDGATVYVGVKSYTPNWGRANGSGQTAGSQFRIWLSNPDDTYVWDELVDIGFVYDANGKPVQTSIESRKGSVPTATTAQVANITGSTGVNDVLRYVINDDNFILAFTMNYADVMNLTANNTNGVSGAASAEAMKYAITHSFHTKTNTAGVAINESFVQLTSGRYLGNPNAGYTNSNVAYRVVTKVPAVKLARSKYTADESLKKNVLADVYYAADYKATGGYVDTIINPALAELNGIAARGRLNDGIYNNADINSGDATKNFCVSLNVHDGTIAPVYNADAANEISFELLREYELASFKAVFMRRTSWGITNPNYVDVYVTDAAGNTQRVGRCYESHTSDNELVSYDIVLNKAVKGNKVTFKYDAVGNFIFASEFQAYAYGDIIANTTSCNNYNDGGYGTVMLYGQNSSATNSRAWWTEKVFKYDTNLGAYYVVNSLDPTGTAADLGLNYKTGDFALMIHGNALSGANATAATKANYTLVNSLRVGERVYLYNNAYNDANYDLMMQGSSDNFFITLGSALMSKQMTSYDPTVGYLYNISDLAQIGDGKSSMIIIDSQSKPDNTDFSDNNLPVDSFTVGGLLNSSINLWNYNVAIVEYDTTAKTYYIANFMAKIKRPNNITDAAWNTQMANNNAAKRALSFTTQGFAIISLNGGELFDRLSRMWANNYNLSVDKTDRNAPDSVYLYDIDLDALRLSYGNAGTLNAKVAFNNKNGNSYVTTTESWVDLAEASLTDLTNRWLKDLEAIKSQVSTDTYNNLKAQISNNLKYARAYALFANKFNNHEYTAGLRANPWIMYDGKIEASSLSFDENIFALWNRNSQWSIGATQTAGIMLMNTNKNYEAKTEVNGFNKNFAALHDNDYAGLNYVNKITYTFYYDFANGYNVPETLRVYTSANYSFMNHTKPFEVTLTDKTADNGDAYPTSGSGTWTITVDVPLAVATAIYTEYDFTSKQLGVVEINEKCVITDLLVGDINALRTSVDSHGETVGNTTTQTIIGSVTNGVITFNHKHTNASHVCTTECAAYATNSFYGNTFIDLSATPMLRLVAEVPANLSNTTLTLDVYYNGVSRKIALGNIFARDVVDGKIEVEIDFADFCKNTYGMTLKAGELLQLNAWSFSTKFADKTAGTIKISEFKFIGADEAVSGLVAGSAITIDEDNKLIVLDQQYKESALKQEFTGAIAVEGTAKNGFVGTGAKVTVNGTVYTVVLYGDLNGDGTVNPADYIMIRRALLKTLVLDDVQTKAAIGPKASKITATTYIQIRQHVLGTYNFFKGEKIAQ